jgi:hypothetical protein
MADPEPPKSKYQCLVDAVTDAGLASKLPPIAPGTEVEEQRPDGSSNLPPLRNGAKFVYQGIDGGERTIQGDESLAPDQANPGPQLFLTKSLSVVSLFDKYDLVGDVVSFQNMETNEEAHRNTPAKPGTVGETVDKIIKCRTPPMS